MLKQSDYSFSYRVMADSGFALINYHAIEFNGNNCIQFCPVDKLMLIQGSKTEFRWKNMKKLVVFLGTD